MLPGDLGVAFIPPNGFALDPAIDYVRFDGMAADTIVLSFDSVRDRSGSFTTYGLSHDNRTLYALDVSGNQVATIDLERLEVREIVDLADVPIHSLTGDTEWSAIAPMYERHSIVLSPDGRYLYTLGFPRDHEGAITITPEVWKIDTANWSVVASWVPDSPWVASSLSIDGAGGVLHVSLSEITRIVDPAPDYRVDLEARGFVTVSTSAFGRIAAYFNDDGYLILGTSSDLRLATWTGGQSE